MSNGDKSRLDAARNVGAQILRTVDGNYYTFDEEALLSLFKWAESCGRAHASNTAQRLANDYRLGGMIGHACALDGLAGMIERYNAAVDSELLPVLQRVADRKLLVVEPEGHA